MGDAWHRSKPRKRRRRTVGLTMLSWDHRAAFGDIAALVAAEHDGVALRLEGLEGLE